MAAAAVEINTSKDTSLGDSYDQSYEDDFEKDSSIEEKPTQKSSPFKATEQKPDDNEEDRNNNVKSPTEDTTAKTDKSPSQEQQQQQRQQPHDNGKQQDSEHNHRVTPVSRDPHRPGGDVEAPSDNDSEPEDTYNFTDDQRRAMMELIVQKQEDVDLLDEEPPEYDVRDRLVLLNAELANEPDPEENQRKHKVGFKSEIVDLVAPPPPDFSDDESVPNSARGEPQPTHVAPVGGGKFESTVDNAKKGNSENSDDGTKKIVVERDGNFEVLNEDDLTADERAMYIPEESKENAKKPEKQSQKTNDSKSSDARLPRPPARPRPNTAAATSGSRRHVVRPSQSPRPKSAGHTSISSSNSSLDNFNYNSPYAMTSEQKEHAREMARKMEEERREKDRRKHEENEERKKQSESAFSAWLEAKREERRRQQQQQHNDDGQRSEQERSEQDEEESEEAFKNWMREKRQQGKKEKLLKRRQQQEHMEGFYIRPREDCDKAFKEWLKRKNADLRRQQELERQRNRMYRVQMKRSKKTNMLLKALKESNSFRYVDYYGYR